jgi:hypothetical protein
MLFSVYARRSDQRLCVWTIDAKDIHHLRFRLNDEFEKLRFKVVPHKIACSLGVMQWTAVDAHGNYCPIYSCKCRYCNKSSDIWMVHDLLWAQHVEYYTDFLCISCFEHRLGRKLTIKDFTSAPCNAMAALWLRKGNSCNM